MLVLCNHLAVRELSLKIFLIWVVSMALERQLCRNLFKPIYMHARRLFSFMIWSVIMILWPSLSCAQIIVIWPEDVHASCEENLESFAEPPLVTLGESCAESVIDFVDAAVEDECPQNIVVDRTWTVTACDSILTHVQRIALTDASPPYVLNPSASAHFFSYDLDWLPLVRDNCDSSLGGEISFSDTTDLCCGVTSFVVNLHVPDDCGNLLDTAYTVFLHDLEPYLACDETSSAPCGEGTVLDDVTGTCIPLELCAPGPEVCGPFTVWNESLGLCVPETLTAACYFDSDGDGSVGTLDLLNFLSAYGQTCESNLNSDE